MADSGNAISMAADHAEAIETAIEPEKTTMKTIESSDATNEATEPDEAPKTAPTTSSWRRRQAKQAKQQHPSTSDQVFLTRDNARARAERRLLENTRKLPHQCRLGPARLAVFDKLFAEKDRPAEEKDRAKDDIVRRIAVKEIMEAREAHGWEPKGESKRWRIGFGAGKELDVETELNEKFDAEDFKEHESGLAERKSQRKFLEWSLAQPNKSGIPSGRIPWLRQILNDLVAPATADKLNHCNKRVQAIYYIMACRKEIGCTDDWLPIFSQVAPGTPDEDYLVEVHNYLVDQKPEFFEGDFLDIGVPLEIEVDMSEMMQNNGEGEKQDTTMPMEGSDSEGEQSGPEPVPAEDYMDLEGGPEPVPAEDYMDLE